MGDRVGVELLYNAVKTEVERVGSGRGSWQLGSTSQLSSGQRVRVTSRVPDSWRRGVVGKVTPDRGGHRKPRWSLGSREDADKMQ